LSEPVWGTAIPKQQNPNYYMSKKHHVSFNAHRKMPIETPVAFQTKNGFVSFEAKKKVSVPVHVDFIAKNKPK
jgi:hypothetical protein